jgi:NitT/TauT family transport system permease protein
MAGTFPSRGVWRRPTLRPVDLLVFAALLALLYGLLRLAPSLNAPFLPKTAPSTVSTDPANLPYYAVRSLFRMFIALFIAIVFTFAYAEAAARLPRAEKVLIPLLDILQSVRCWASSRSPSPRSLTCSPARNSAWNSRPSSPSSPRWRGT